MTGVRPFLRKTCLVANYQVDLGTKRYKLTSISVGGLEDLFNMLLLSRRTSSSVVLFFFIEVTLLHVGHVSPQMLTDLDTPLELQTFARQWLDSSETIRRQLELALELLNLNDGDSVRYSSLEKRN